MENKLNQSNLSPDMFKVVGQESNESEKIIRPSLTFWHDAWRRLIKNKGALVGLVVVIIFILLAIFGPMMSGYTYKQQDIANSKLPPRVQGLENISWLPFDGVDKNGVNVYEEKGIEDRYHWFGTDDLGRDQWTRVWYGARISLYIAVLAAVIEFFIGITYGGVSGFFGGRVDAFMQRIIEVLVGIPYLIVVILMILVFEKPGVLSITLAMVVTGWIGMARMVRGQFLKLKNQEYVLASKTLGASNASLIFKHLLPNVLGPIIVTSMFTIPGAIFTEAFLSFIGLGITAPEASLGSLVNDGFRYIKSYPYLLIIPSIAISILILSFNLLADGLRDALDPKMRK